MKKGLCFIVMATTHNMEREEMVPEPWLRFFSDFHNPCDGKSCSFGLESPRILKKHSLHQWRHFLQGKSTNCKWYHPVVWDPGKQNQEEEVGSADLLCPSWMLFREPLWLLCPPHHHYQKLKTNFRRPHLLFCSDVSPEQWKPNPNLWGVCFSASESNSVSHFLPQQNHPHAIIDTLSCLYVTCSYWTGMESPRQGTAGEIPPSSRHLTEARVKKLSTILSKLWAHAPNASSFNKNRR